MKAKSFVRLFAGAMALLWALACAAAQVQDTPEEAERVAAVAAESGAPPGRDGGQATARASSGGAVNTAEVIPLIVMDDLPLTDAIRNLARQAGINYLMDPKVAFGVPGPDGKVVPMPSVSIRWEKVTAQQALEALLNNYDLQLVQDPKTGIARITVKDPAAPDPLVTKILQLKYANPSNLVAAVQSSFTDRRSKALADVRTSQLVVVATEKELGAVEELIERLDIPPRQVLIEARLMEISRSPSTIKGIDWGNTLEGQNVSFGNGLTTAETITTVPGAPPAGGGPAPRYSRATTMTTLSGVGGISLNTFNGFNPNIAFLNADGVRAVLSFLNKDADTQVISTPRAVTLDNETARLAVTRAVPIFRVQASTPNTTGGSEVNYTNLGTVLEVTPRITANDHIFLKVVPEVSSIFRTVQKRVVDTVNEADEYDIRKIETQVLIPNSHTLVMGGLMSDSTKNEYSKVPLLGDIPVLGMAFRHEKKALDKKNLLIFITPTILKDADFMPAQTDFLQSKPTELTSGIDPDSAWEGARPRDWSHVRSRGSRPEPRFQEPPMQPGGLGR
jgi:type II secretory pathway component GspD/PulD (secretin)